MATRVESQAGGTDDEAAPSIPSAFENDHMLEATEAIMWIACRRRFSHDTIREHLRRHRDRGQWRYGRSQLRRPLQERAEKAERQLIGLIIGGVPATGTLDDEGDPDHKKRVHVPVEFLKDGAYIELLSGHIRADPLLDKHSEYQRPTYRDVDIDRDAFFKALAAVRRRTILPCGPLVEVQLDFWTHEQIKKFIEIEKAFVEFCEADPKLSDLDSRHPGPKSEKFEEWYTEYCPVHDAATERFVDLFREKILVAWVLRDDKEDDDGVALPPEYWAPSIASLTFTKGKVEGLLLNERHKHLANSRVVLRRDDREKWANGATLDSQQGRQEFAETPVPEIPEDEPRTPRKKPAELMHKRWVERAKELKGLNPDIQTSAIASKLRTEDLRFNEQTMRSNDPDEPRVIRDIATIRRVLTNRRKEWELPQ